MQTHKGGGDTATWAAKHHSRSVWPYSTQVALGEESMGKVFTRPNSW